MKRALRSIALVLTFVGCVLSTATPAQAADPKISDLRGGADCGGFGVAQAAAWLKVPAGQVSRHVEKGGPSLRLCSFSVAKAPPAIAFSVEVAANAKKSAVAMDRYRVDLAVGGETAPFKGKLPQGAYSDITGLGDEAIWTDVNGALSVRKGNATVQFTRPKATMEQIRIAQSMALFSGRP